MTCSDQNMAPESGLLGSAPVQITGVEQTGATGANPLGSSCSAPLLPRGADNWSSGAKPYPVRLEQNQSKQDISPSKQSVFAFTERPPLGTIARLDGQPYLLVEVRPHIRRDGKATELTIWEAPCAACGSPFQVSMPLTGSGKGPVRRCPSHRQPGLKVARTQSVTFPDPEDLDQIKETKMENAPTDWSPVGKFGHTLTDAGEIEFQFRVVAEVGTDRYVVELFSWLTGEATEKRIWPIERLIDCPLFDTEQAWVAAADKAG